MFDHSAILPETPTTSAVATVAAGVHASASTRPGIAVAHRSATQQPQSKSKSMVRPKDPELMLRVKRGEVDAFADLVERHKGLVYGLCLSMLRSREDAEEAAQDTFLKLFRSRELYDQGRPLEPWLLRIAGNTSRDVLRRRMGSRVTVVRDGDGDLLMQLIEDQKAATDNDQTDTRQAVRHAIAQMQERFRLPLLLRYLNGLTNQRIAEALGISVSNVKMRLARAKDVLQSRLSGVCD